jgi:HK97 family phage portal protein
MIIKFGPITLSTGADRFTTKATLADIQGAGSSDTTEAQEWARTSYGSYYATSTPAYRAVKLRADAIASAPLVVHKGDPRGDSKPVGPDHPIQSLLDHVNPWWTRADLLKATETYLSLWGSAFWFINRDVPEGSRHKVELWPLRPDNVEIVADPGDKGSNKPNVYIRGYKYTRSVGRTVVLLPEEVVWFRYINPLAEFGGLSPVAAARLSLDMGRDALSFNRRFFQTGAMPQDLVFTVNGPIAEEEAEAFYARLHQRHAGVSRAHRPMLWDLSQGGKPERLGLTQRDMEFMAALNYTVEDASRVWGVPPPKMYSQTRSIYNNVKQADIEFYTDTISSEWSFLESEVNELLFSNLRQLRIIQEDNLFVSFDTSKILPLQEALSDLRNTDRADVQAGILTINESRAARGLSPVDWGDVWWRPSSTAVTIDAEKPEPPPPPPPPPPDEDDEDIDEDSDEEEGKSMLVPINGAGRRNGHV